MCNFLSTFIDLILFRQRVDFISLRVLVSLVMKLISSWVYLLAELIKYTLN